MKVDLFSYNLPLKKSIQINNTNINSREGILIRFRNNEGYTGWGESAPLPGLSKETFEETLDELDLIIAELLKKEMFKRFCNDLKYFKDWSLTSNLKPTVKFGIETGLINLCAQTENYIFFKNKEYKKKLYINGLLGKNNIAYNDQISEFIKNGYSSIKIKVGNNNIQDDINKINSISKYTGNQISLRLDANRSWSINEALLFADKIKGSNIEYFEEPTYQLNEIEHFYKKTGIYTALDETITENNYNTFKPLTGVKAIILKPVMLGGIFITLEWIKWANKFNIIPIISDTFSTGIGLKIEAVLASAVITEKINIPHGLGTYSFLKEDLIKPDIPFKDNFIEIDKLIKTNYIIRKNKIKHIKGF